MSKWWNYIKTYCRIWSTHWIIHVVQYTSSNFI